MSDRLTIGVLIPLIRGAYFRGLLRGINRVTRANGAQLIVIQTVPPLGEYDTNPLPAGLVPYAWNSIDGCILIQDAVNSADAQMIVASGKPLVTIASSYLGVECLDVHGDDAGGAMTAVRHLLDHGHRRIAFFGHPLKYDLQQRYEGYKRALLERGIEPDPSLLYPTDDQTSGGTAATQRLIDEGVPCTAAFAGTDINAIAVMRAVQAAGYRVPEDLAIVGFDDVPAAQRTSPALTTIRQSFDELGSTAATLLLARLAGHADLPQSTCVAGALVERSSCGCRAAGVLKPAPIPERGEAHPQQVEQLTRRLAAGLRQPAPLPPAEQPEHVPSAVTAIAAGLIAAVEGTAPPADEVLDRAWQAAHGSAANLEALNGAFAVLEQAAAALVADRDGDTPAPERVAAYLQQARLHCLRACQMAGERRSDFLEGVIWRDYDTSVLLMNVAGERLLDLAWLKHTPIARASLARWDELGQGGCTPRSLAIKGYYSRESATPIALGSTWAVEAFPPAAFTADLRETEDADPIIILPMRTATLDWGSLVVSTPCTSPTSGDFSETLDSLSQLAGLLAAALERDELLRSLQAERQLLQTLFDTMPDHIYFKDRNSRVLRANKAQATYFGYRDPADEIGKNDFDFYPHEVAQAFYDAEQEIMRTGQLLVGVLEDHSAFAHRPCWIQSTKVPVVQDGSIVGLVGISRDVTEMKRAEEVLAHQTAAAEDLARLRSNFVATVSHELRSPLTAIVGYAELLEAQWARLDDPERLKMIHHIAAAANRQMRLVEELLLLSRLELGAIAVKPEPVALSSLVSRAAEEIRTSYEGQGIDLEGPDNLLVVADPDRALQILLNLIDNAAKYSPEGSPIRVQWTREGTHAVVRVRDFGIGVSEEGRQRLFTRFGRVPGSRIRAGRVGTGLGLYLARSFAQVMNGEVELESTGPAGSTFRLKLPLARTPRPTAAKVPEDTRT